MFQGLQESQLAGALEALLFVTDEPVGTIALADMLEVEPADVEQALVGLRARFETEERGVQLREVAGGFASGRRDIRSDKLDWLYHTTACRAAIKAGNISRPVELQKLAERVLLQDDIRTCPHGRPVCIELTKREIEKQFGRV